MPSGPRSARPAPRRGAGSEVARRRPPAGERAARWRCCASCDDRGWTWSNWSGHRGGDRAPRPLQPRDRLQAMDAREAPQEEHLRWRCSRACVRRGALAARHGALDPRLAAAGGRAAARAAGGRAAGARRGPARAAGDRRADARRARRALRVRARCARSWSASSARRCARRRAARPTAATADDHARAGRPRRSRACCPTCCARRPLLCGVTMIGAGLAFALERRRHQARLRRPRPRPSRRGRAWGALDGRGLGGRACSAR